MTSQNTELASLDRQVGRRRVWSPSRLAANAALKRRLFHTSRVEGATSEVQKRWRLLAWIHAEVDKAQCLSTEDLKSIAMTLNEKAARGGAS